MTGPSRRHVLAGGLPAIITATAGCLEFDDSSPSPPPVEEPPTPHPANEVGPQTPAWETTGSPLEATFEATTVVEGLEEPWDVAFGPDEAVITERAGRIRRLDRERLTGEATVSATDLEVDSVELPDLIGEEENGDGSLDGAEGESGNGNGNEGGDESGNGDESRSASGLLGITLHPDYPDPAFVYLCYTAVGERLINRVVRYDATAAEPTVEPVVDSIPGAEINNGGRIAFGPDDALWILTGDADEELRAQEPGSLVGSVLRVAPDGKPLQTDDLPAGGDPRLFSYGHRDVTGISWLPDGTPIVTERGPDSHDEVSLLWPGANYGWAVARGNPEDQEGEYDTYDDHPDFVPPVADSGAETRFDPGGGVWYDAEAIPELQNRFLFGGVESERLFALTLLGPDTAPPEDAHTVFDADWLDDRYLALTHELFASDYGHIRHVAQGPEGNLYLLTWDGDGDGNGEGDGRLIRLEAE